MAATSNPESTTLETTLDLLRSPLRRELVLALHESDSLSRDGLAETLTAGSDRIDAETRRRMRIALHHNHLPRLADAGLVTYDDETVIATDRLGRAVRELERFDDLGQTVRQS